MSLLVSDAIAEMQIELTIAGQKIGTDDFYLYLNRANKFFYTGFKMPTCEKLTDAIVYSSIKEYPLPTDFIGLIMPKRPPALWSPNFMMNRPTDIAHWPHGRLTGIAWSQETPYAVLNDEAAGSNVALNNCESLTENGTWAVSGDGSALAVDDQTYSAGIASLRFNVTASGGTTTLACTNMDQVDLTDYIATGFAFIDLKPPNTNTVAITSVAVRIGSDASNYYLLTATTRFRGDSILSGFGPIGFDWSTKTTVGSPDVTALDYLQIVITHGTSSAVNGIWHIDNIFSALGVYYQLPYYSKYNVKSNGGVYKEKVSSTDDSILCPSDFEEAYTYKALEQAAAERLKDQGLATYFARELAPKLAYLKSKYPRQEQRVQTQWYKPANNF